MHVLKDVGGRVRGEAHVTGAQAAWVDPNNSLWGGLTAPGAWAVNQSESHRVDTGPLEILFWQQSDTVSTLSEKYEFPVLF